MCEAGSIDRGGILKRLNSTQKETKLDTQRGVLGLSRFCVSLLDIHSPMCAMDVQFSGSMRSHELQMFIHTDFVSR